MEEIYKLLMNTVESISFSSILDILVVSYILYKGYVLIKETRAEQLLKGIVLIIILIPISYIFKLNMLSFILNKTLTVGVLSIAIIFQPEIRRILEKLGRSAFEEIHSVQGDEDREKLVNEIVIAVNELAQSKTGALIVIEQSTGLGEITGSGTVVDARLSANLLENIFAINTPLHDGATIIRKGRIYVAGCVLPLTSNVNISQKLGTRHRAAMGISESSDALVIVVSEETGVISLAANGRLTRNYDKDKLNNILVRIMKKRESKKIKTAREKVKEWIRALKK